MDTKTINNEKTIDGWMEDETSAWSCTGLEQEVIL